MYYVYAYLREDGSPYYIGKGKGKRAFSNKHSVNLPPDASRIVFLEKNLSDIGACALERRYIRWYGRKDNKTGILRNKTEGGDGNSGSRSKEWCENHSNKMKGRPMRETTKEKMRKIDRSYMQTDEYKKKISEANKGRPNKKLMKPVMTPAGRFESVSDATLHFGVSKPTMMKRLKEGTSYYYLPRSTSE